MCQACTFGIKAAGNDGGASLGEVRGHFFVAAHVHGHNAVLGSNGDGVGIAKHHRHARLPSALAIALRARGIAWAINIAEALWRTVAAVAVAEQLSSAAQVTVAPSRTGDSGKTLTTHLSRPTLRLSVPVIAP